MSLLVFRRELLRVLGDSESLLDVGCGSCSLEARLRGGWRGFYVGIDLRRPPRGVQGDAQMLPFRNSAFDTVVFIHSLEHLPDYYKGLEEAWRVLRERGVLFIQAPTPSNYYATSLPDHLHVLHHETLSRLVSRIGFRVVEARGEESYLLVIAVKQA